MLDETTMIFTMGVVSVIAVLFSIYVKFLINDISHEMRLVNTKMDNIKMCINDVQIETLTKIGELSERVARIESNLNNR